MTIGVIGFAGMSHLGLVSAAAAAERGWSVLCFDPDAQAIAGLKRGVMPVSEPQLDALYTKHRDRIALTANPEDLATCALTYVARDVPTDDQGNSDLAALDALVDLAFDYGHVDAPIVVLSQVPPGYTRARQRSGRTLLYQVETLIFGQAIDRALNPERYIVGLADSAEPLPPIVQTFLGSHGDPPILPMQFESAELAKISINCCLVASIAVANTLAELCESIGADWSEIAPALKLDQRIGPHAYLAPGLGIAGGNLERDLATVRRFADANQTDAGIVDAWLANSNHRKNWSYETLKAEVLDRNPGARIAVWGLAYKENTHSVKNSPALACLAHLNDYDVAVHDPWVDGAAVPFAQSHDTPEACANGADVLMILTPWPAFKSIEPESLATIMKGRTIIDPYQCLSRAKALAAGFDYIALGAPPARAADVSDA